MSNPRRRRSTSFSIKECPCCEARWLDGQLYWATGREACPHDLAGLVCNELSDETCINACKGSTSGLTWKHREIMLDFFDI